MLSRDPRRAASSRRRKASGPRFVADAMLGSLARKLRAFGFDTVYYRNGSDSGLIALATSEDRILLTSDRGLSELARARGALSLMIAGSKESRRLLSLRKGADAEGLVLQRGPPRCSLCNGELRQAPKAHLVGRIPAGVLRRHRLFFQCVHCGSFYWRGSHWKKLRWLETLLEQDPDALDSRRRQRSSRTGQADA